MHRQVPGRRLIQVVFQPREHSLYSFIRIFITFSFHFVVEPYHCKGKFIEDFEALCRQAQITFIVPVVSRPRPPATPMPTASLADGKDKAAQKTGKGTASKERDATAPQQQQPHSELDNTENAHGLSRKITEDDL